MGRLDFFDGFPTAATTRTVYDNPDLLRAVEVFLNFVPMASLEGVRRGLTVLYDSAPTLLKKAAVAFFAAELDGFPH